MRGGEGEFRLAAKSRLGRFGCANAAKQMCQRAMSCSNSLTRARVQCRSCRRLRNTLHPARRTFGQVSGIPQVACRLLYSSSESAHWTSFFRRKRRPRSRRLLELGGSGREPAASVYGNSVVQRNGQTCHATFVQFERGSRSCASRGRSKTSDGAEDSSHHRTDDGDLGRLEGDGASVTDDTHPDLDQLQLQAVQRPVRHDLGQFDAAQGGGQIVGQRDLLQPYLVVAELPA